MSVPAEVLQSRAPATKAAILGATRKVFLRKGFHRATVDDITKQASVAHGTFYRYFRNKQEALYALVAEAISRLQLPKRDWAHEDMFRAIHDDLTAVFESARRERELTIIWREASSYDEKVAEARQALQRPFLDRIAESIRAGIRNGLIAEIDVDVATRALASMADEFSFNWFVLDNRDDDPSAVADTVATIWWRGLGYNLTQSS